jgi:hypothetical protein
MSLLGNLVFFVFGGFPQQPLLRCSSPCIPAVVSKPFLVATRAKQQNSALNAGDHSGRSTADSASFHVNVASGRLLLANTRFNL